MGLDPPRSEAGGLGVVGGGNGVFRISGVSGVE